MAGEETSKPQAHQPLDLLARRFRPALARYFARRVAHPADAEDLVQEVFTRIAARTSGELIRDPKPYLMQAAANVLRDWLRRRATHAAGAHDVYDEDLHASEVFSPERVLEGRQSVMPVLAALGELSESTRNIFVLCRIDGMKYAEVARRLGVSVSAIEKHMMKAIAHLGDRLGDR